MCCLGSLQFVAFWSHLHSTLSIVVELGGSLKSSDCDVVSDVHLFEHKENLKKVIVREFCLPVHYELVQMLLQYSDVSFPAPRRIQGALFCLSIPAAQMRSKRGHIVCQVITRCSFQRMLVCYFSK